MTPTANKVRTWLVRNPDMTMAQIARGVGVSPSTISRAFAELGVVNTAPGAPDDRYKAQVEHRGVASLRRFAMRGYRWPVRRDMPGHLGSHQRRVLELLFDGPRTATVIGATLGLTRAEVRKRLRALYNRNLVAVENCAPMEDLWSAA